MLLVPTYVSRSPIHGVGVFAREAIPQGTLMWKFQPGLDIIVPAEVVATLPRLARDFLDYYGYVSDMFPGGHVLSFDHARFLNHSDDPNTDNRTEFAYARRDIASGEEITCDYKEFCLDHDLQP